MAAIAYHDFTACPRHLRKLARLLRFKPEEKIVNVKSNRRDWWLGRAKTMPFRKSSVFRDRRRLNIEATRSWFGHVFFEASRDMKNDKDIVEVL